MPLPPFLIALKSDLSLDDTVEFINSLTKDGKETFENLRVAVPYLRLKELAHRFPDSGIIFGTTELFSTLPESFSAPVAIDMAKQAGAQFTLIGTMEERIALRHSNKALLAKLNACKAYGLKALYVFGNGMEQTEAELKDALLLFQEAKIFDSDPHPILIYDLPLKTLEHYFPTTKELKDMKKAIDPLLEELFQEHSKAASVFASFPADLAGFSEGVKITPFDGVFIKKSGIYPHAVHQETLELFHVECTKQDG